MGSTVLVLRAQGTGERTAESLRARGHVPVLLPLERSESTREPPPPGEWRAFAVTSANALAPLAEAFPGDGRPLLCVGAATGRTARSLGFPSVTFGDGEAASLARTVIGMGVAGPILYAAGMPRTGTLERAFDGASIAFGVWETYRTVALDPGAAAVEAALDGPAGRIDAVLVLSGGQAEAFRRIVVPLLGAAHPPRCLCLSARIAGLLGPELGPLVEIADEPSLPSLFERLG